MAEQNDSIIKRLLADLTKANAGIAEHMRVHRDYYFSKLLDGMGEYQFRKPSKEDEYGIQTEIPKPRANHGGNRKRQRAECQ